MELDELGRAASAAAPAVGTVIALVTLIVKIRESNGRTRAHSIAVESFALAKSVAELGPGDAGYVLAACLRNDLLRTGNEAARRYQRLTRPKRRMVLNWVDAVAYSVICVLLGIALWEVSGAFPAAGGNWPISLRILGVFFVGLGAYVFGSVVVLIVRRRRVLLRLTAAWWLKRKQRILRHTRIEASEGSQAS